MDSWYNSYQPPATAHEGKQPNSRKFINKQFSAPRYGSQSSSIDHPTRTVT
jgi:hypothetical protein